MSAQSLLATGNFTGTGVAIKIECGFAPRRVEVINATKLSTTTWVRGMVTNMDEGFHAIDTGAGAVDFSLLTANGISAFAGEAAYTAITGTFDCTIGVASVAAGDTTTWFLEELKVGDEILLSGVVYSIVAIASDTALTVDRPIGATVNEGTLVRVTGRGAGFVVGTTAGLNSDNDECCYTAFA